MAKRIKILLKTKAGERPLTDLEKCMLVILKMKDNISSVEILKAAKGVRLCAACSDRSEVFSTGERLIRNKIIKRKLKGNEYFWSLTKKGISFAKII